MDDEYDILAPRPRHGRIVTIQSASAIVVKDKMTRVTVFGASGVQGAAQVKVLVAAGHHPVVSAVEMKQLHISQTTAL